MNRDRDPANACAGLKFSGLSAWQASPHPAFNLTLRGGGGGRSERLSGALSPLQAGPMLARPRDDAPHLGPSAAARG